MAASMRAAVYHGPGDVRIESRDVPAPRPGELLVRVTRSGVCGTDATEWKAGPKVFPVHREHSVSGHVGPLIPGHEFIGVVEDGSERFPVGTRVASGAGVSCGRCDRCAEGRTNLCREYRTLGLNVDGAMAEFVAVPESILVAIPETLSDDAAGLAQPLAVGLHAARRAEVRSGDRVLLMGAGAIGTFVLAGIRKLVPAADVTVTDFSGSRLERATRIGAAKVVAVDDPGYEPTLESWAKRFDVVIEASGAPGQLSRAISAVRDGGTILQVGIPSAPQEVDIHQLVFREISIVTTLAHVCGVDLPDALDILETTPLADELLDSVRPLAELPEQLQLLATGRLEGKVLFDPSR